VRLDAFVPFVILPLVLVAPRRILRRSDRWDWLHQRTLVVGMIVFAITELAHLRPLSLRLARSDARSSLSRRAVVRSPGQ